MSERYLLKLGGVVHDSYWCVERRDLPRVELLTWAEASGRNVVYCGRCVLDRWPTIEGR